MKPSVLLDYQAPVERDGFVVRALLKLEGQAPENGRAPLNISLVLDRSGSMSGDKLHFARKAAAMLVRRLSPEDVVSAVTYDNEVHTVAPPARGDAQPGLADAIGRRQRRRGRKRFTAAAWAISEEPSTYCVRRAPR